jgi:phosphate acyltransferase
MLARTRAEHIMRKSLSRHRHARIVKLRVSPIESAHIVDFMQGARSFKTGERRLGIDIMGGETSPESLLQAISLLSQELPSVHFTIFGKSASLEKFSSPFIRLIPTREIIHMEDDPLLAVRRKKESSLCVGMRMLQKGELDAFISTGNTGALIASAKMYLRMLKSIDRPALLALLPTKKKPVAVLDVGANVTFKADHLVQFASMGIAYQRSRGIAHPTVGLLNIGSEKKKGTRELQEAYQKLQLLNRDSTIFIGNVEGGRVFSGEIDVLVSDGFTGNVFLKTAEGIATFILDHLEQTVEEGFSPKIKEILYEIRHRLHYAEHPGAILCGVEGIVIKCHGDSRAEALVQSIKATTRLVEHSFLEAIKSQLENSS